MLKVLLLAQDGPQCGHVLQIMYNLQKIQTTHSGKTNCCTAASNPGVPLVSSVHGYDVGVVDNRTRCQCVFGLRG